VLEEMIAVAVTLHLPLCHDGRPPRAKTSEHFSLLPVSGNSQPDLLPADFIARLFQKTVWTESTSRIVSGLIYTQFDVAKEFVAWLNSGAWTKILFDYLVIAVHSLLDSLGIDAIGLLHDTTIFALFERMLPQHRRPEDLGQLCIRCICIMIETDVARQQQLASMLCENMQRHAIEHFAFESMCIACRLQSSPSLADLITKLAEHGLQWAVRHFGGSESEDEVEARTLVYLSASERPLKQYGINRIRSETRQERIQGKGTLCGTSVNYYHSEPTF